MYGLLMGFHISWVWHLRLKRKQKNYLQLIPVVLTIE